jgi:hypothetical protein
MVIILTTIPERNKPLEGATTACSESDGDFSDDGFDGGNVATELNLYENHCMHAKQR